MAFYLARTAMYSHKNSHAHYTQKALSNHIHFVSIREILPRAIAKYTCLQKLLKWLTVIKRLNLSTNHPSEGGKDWYEWIEYAAIGTLLLGVVMLSYSPGPLEFLSIPKF